MNPRIRRETTPVKRGWTIYCPDHRRYVGGHYDTRETAEAVWDQHVREAHE